jgi:chemotaxis regulatin CheY-phosphate phosphatase CheZ
MDGLAVNISVKAPKTQALPATQAVPLLEQGETADPNRLADELDYYRQVSQDIYLELGRLAKNLNLSLQDLTMAEVIHTQMDSPGEHLDLARNQVSDVLAMTEKATLNILDLVEQIQDECQEVRRQLLGLPSLPAPGEMEFTLGADPGWEEARALLPQILAQGEELNQQFQAQTADNTGAVAASLHFPLGEVLQIILEFCGNEALKQHLKMVITRQGEIFRTSEAEAAISRLAADLPEEEGFSQLPVEEVLRLLQAQCSDDRVKDLFNKMIASAGKLFPMPILPLEGHAVEAPADTSTSPGFLPLWNDFFQKLQQLSSLATAPPPPVPPGDIPENGAGVEAAIQGLDRITASLSRIMEALSFQDLSGQRLLQVLNLLRQVQVQVLSLVIAAGTKLKKKVERKEISVAESGALAQDEIDRLMQSVTTPPVDSEVPAASMGQQNLDQNAVNDLLTSLGF